MKKQSGSLAQAYDDLADRIIEHNKFDFLSMAKAATALQRGGEIEDAEAKFQEILATFPERILMPGSRMLSLFARGIG